MSVGMALVDYIPVGLFIAAALLLMRDLYNKMSKGAFALFSAGTLMIMIAGIYKATWKLLYGAGICDFAALNRAFFPMQATGFVLAAAGILALLCVRQGKGTVYALAPMLYESSLIFVILTVLGTLGICASLTVMALRMKKRLAAVCFVLAFFFMLGMGYLSSRDFAEAAMNWIAQGVNIVGQGMLLAGVLILHKAGLARAEALQRVQKNG